MIPRPTAIAEADWTRATAVLADAGSVALSCHLGPDGDALGSMLALGLALRARGAEAVASWGSEPFALPKQYAFLPGLDLVVPPGRFPASPDVLVTFDAGSAERLGTLEPNAGAARCLVVVDHHASTQPFGHVNLIDPAAAASAVIAYELIGRLGLEIDRDVATCLYTGIVTDTGRFQYRNTTPVVHAIAGDLLARGVAHDEVTRVIYDTHPIGFLRLASEVLERLRYRPEANMVWSYFTQADLARHGIGIEDTDALIDLVRTADVADVAALLKESPDGRYKVSMRSKGASDVGALCESFGGGGHALAAGFTANGRDPAETIEEIVRALRR